MARSLKVAPKHIEKVKLALKRSGFPSVKAFATEMGIAYATASKFFNGKAVDYINFVEFCEKLCLNWQETTTDEESTATTPLDKGGQGGSTPENIPKSNSIAFVGRDKQLTELHQLLQRNNQVVIAAINGMGGVGKTELAIQYATQHLLDYPGGICWVNAQGLLAGLQILRFAEIQFNIVPPDDWELADKLQFCWSKWHPGELLFIFDDVFDYKQQVKPFLPKSSRFKVLLTTRFQFDSTWQQLRLDVLKPLAAMRLLKSIVGEERIKQEAWIARRLCKFLGYLPLALELVGRYLDLQPNLSLAKLLRRLEKQRLDHAALIAANDLMRYEFGVEEAINLSWEQLDENAKILGCYLSVFALAAIPLSTDRIEDEDEQETMEKALRDLQHWHLLQEVRQETYRLHPLIRQFLQKRLDELAEAKEMKRNFAALMVAVANQIDYQLTREDVIKFSPWIPHIEEVANNWAEFLDDEDLITPFHGLGRFYKGQSFSQQAEVWYQQCQDIVKQRLGEEHPDFAAILNNLAELYSTQGKYSEAEPLYLEVLSIDRQSLPENHPNIATDLKNLALLYESQGKYSEAESLFLQAWEILQGSLGAEHPDTVTLRQNLAIFWIAAINENRADLEVLQNNPLFLEIMREILAQNLPDE
jgi:tetratricopeptide (TPR) repeat protein